MAQFGTIKCTDCGTQFEGTLGGLIQMEQYACRECDRIEMVPRFPRRKLAADDSATFTKEEKPKSCRSCGGEMTTGLERKCPKCGSRSTEMIKVQMYMD